MTSLTPEQWAALAALIENCWKDDFDDARADAYYQALSHFDADELHAAVLDVAGRPGGAFIPSTQEIAAVVHAARKLGSWQWAHDTLVEAVRRTLATDGDMALDYANGRLPGCPDVLRDELLDVGGRHGPRLVEFVEQCGGPRDAVAWGEWEQRTYPKRWEVLGTVRPAAIAAA